MNMEELPGTPGPEKVLESPEAREVIETARQERLGLLQGVFDRLGKAIDAKFSKPVQFLGSTAFNYVGLPGAIKMMGEAYRGTLTTGQRLTPLGRMNHVLIQGTNLLAYGLAIQGRFKEAGISYAASWAVDAVQYYPEILKALRELAASRGLTGIDESLRQIGEVADRTGVGSLFFEKE